MPRWMLIGFNEGTEAKKNDDQKHLREENVDC